MEWLYTTWYGILTICVVSLVLLFVLSALLYKQFFKRFYDILLSGIALIILFPFFLVITPIIAIAMKGNPFFTQLRPGKNEKIFKLIKYRTMTNTKDENGNLLPDDKRLTKFGKFLRKTSIDELPELINIFLGQMSIVGPRPQLIKDMVFMSDMQRIRHSVKPGLTGLAQISGRNNISWEQKFEFDLIYIKNISLYHDIKIIFLTFLKALKREDTIREGTVSDINFGDWLLKNGKISYEEYKLKMQMSEDYKK